MSDDDDPGFFAALLEETVGPFTDAYIFRVPTGDVIAELDDVEDNPFDVIQLLAGDGLADAILDDLDDQPITATVRLADRVLEHFALLEAPGPGWGWLATTLDRYGPGIEFDLTERGVNLYDFVMDPARWPWDKLARTIQFLPIGGGYRTMMAMDMELAADVERRRREGENVEGDGRPPAYGWTPQHELFTEMADTLGRIEHGIYATSPKHKKAGGRPPKPRKRPRFASENASNAFAIREHDWFASKMLGERHKTRK